MITYFDGDLFRTDSKIIGHGCNAQGVMGSGVAKTMREKYPLNYEHYVHEHIRRPLELGQVLFFEEKGKIIVNMITQDHYGRDGSRYVSYDAIEAIFRTLNRTFSVFGESRIAIPMIGSGLGGGDWDHIADLINQETPDIDVSVYTGR